MLDKLQAIEDKYLQLESMISDPDIIADMNKWQKYTREHSKLGEIVVKFREYKEVLQGLDDAKEMQKEETDDEFKKMIDLEVAELKTKLRSWKQNYQFCCYQKTPMMIKALSLKFVVVLVAMKQRCLRAICLECIRAMLKFKAGKQKF